MPITALFGKNSHLWALTRLGKEMTKETRLVNLNLSVKGQFWYLKLCSWIESQHIIGLFPGGVALVKEDGIDDDLAVSVLALEAGID